MLVAKNNADREARARLRTYQARTQLYTEQLRRRRRDNLWASLAVAVVFVIAVGAQLAYFGVGPGVPTPAPTETSASDNVGNVPDPSLAEGRDWTGSASVGGVPVTFTLNGALAPQSTGRYWRGRCV